MEFRINKVSSYYLRTPDGTIYGPVDIVTLCIWATDARVIPGCALSERQDAWFPVETLPELRLNWSVQLADGSIYGPLNLLAIRVLASEKSIPPGARLSENGNGRKAILDDSLMPLLVEEFHQMLAGCGSLTRDAVGAVREAHQAALKAAEERDAQLLDVQSKLVKAENAHAVSLALASELKSNYTESEAVISKLESAMAHGKTQAEILVTDMRSKIELLQDEVREAQHRGEIISSERVKAQEDAQKTLINERALLQRESQKALQTKETLIEQLEAAQAHNKAQAEAQATEMQAQLLLLKKELQNTQQRAELLSVQLVHVQGGYQTLVNESARKEKEASDKLKQIEQEIKDSTALASKTMLEVERRESQLRDLQVKMEKRERDLSKQGAVVEAEVIHAEVLHVESLGSEEAGDCTASSAAGDREQPAYRQGEPSNKSGILNSVEARLQLELRQWEVLKREQENQKRTGGKWFGRK